jgi:CDP-diacylglycerol--serine O-phosphatidyltransferase
LRKAPQFLKKHIPNALTSVNLACGCLAVIASLNGNLQQASVLIFAAAIVDFFDGFVARALGVQSEIGKQLDSLADMVSFGLAPGMIFYMLSAMVFPMGYACANTYIVLLIPIFSALRLAKFNIDTRQSDSFIGVPTPANTLFITAIPFVVDNDPAGMGTFFLSPYFLTIFPFVSAWMLVAEIPLLALKFKNFSWADNRMRFILLAVCLGSILAFGFLGLALSIIFYVILSLINNIQQKKTS